MNKTIEYYSKNANKFAEEYEKIFPEKVHEHWVQFLPIAKAQILDIGAGSGRDAAWFVKMGHEVVAVEPADALRQRAQELHCDTSIQWIDDYLPTLRKIYKLGLKFDLILICAVWMHIKPSDREKAFSKIVGLLKPGGILVFNLRYGESTNERKMYTVDSETMCERAAHFGLKLMLNTESPDRLGRLNISWRLIVFILDT